MKKRTIKKLLRDKSCNRLLPYGLYRSRGSKKLRRGRRAMLTDLPGLRDWSSLSIERKLDLLERELNRMAAKS